MTPPILRPRPDLLRALAIMWIPLSLSVVLFHLWRETAHGLTAGNTTYAFGDDTINFWAAPRLALQGRAADIYDFAKFHAFQTATLGGPINLYHYSYPPTAILLTLPLGLLPYLAAWAFWLLAGWLLFAWMVAAAWPLAQKSRFDIVLYALAAPAILLNTLTGQNGTWIAAILGGGLMLLQSRPIIAGALLGLLVVKPQMGLLVPVALIAARQWRPLLAMAASGLLLTALSAVLFGIDRWFEFAARTAVLRSLILEDGSGVWSLMVSVFVMLRHVPLSVSVSYTGQAVAAVIAAALVVLVWQGSASARTKNAALLTCSLLATPYLQVYDLVPAALVPLWLLREPRPGAFFASALLLLAPVVSPVIAQLAGIDIGPLMFLPAIGVCLRLRHENQN